MEFNNDVLDFIRQGEKILEIAKEYEASSRENAESPMQERHLREEYGEEDEL